MRRLYSVGRGAPVYFRRRQQLGRFQNIGVIDGVATSQICYTSFQQSIFNIYFCSCLVANYYSWKQSLWLLNNISQYEMVDGAISTTSAYCRIIIIIIIKSASESPYGVLHSAQPCSAAPVPVPSLDEKRRAMVRAHIAINCRETAQLLPTSNKWIVSGL